MCDNIDNSNANSVLIEADGEIIGTLPATWSIIPNQISLLYPVKPAQIEVKQERRGSVE